MTAEVFAFQSAPEPEFVQTRGGDEFGHDVVEHGAVEGADEGAEGGDDDEEDGAEGHGDWRGQFVSALSGVAAWIFREDLHMTKTCRLNVVG